jgi:riboflavin transporter FmnP
MQKITKAKILSVISVILALALSLSSFDFGVKVNLFISAMVIILPVIITYLTEGINDKFINELSKAIILLRDNGLIMGASKNKVDDMSLDEIKSFLRQE